MKKSKPQQIKQDKVNHLIAIGKIDLDLTLNINEVWMQHFQIDPNNIKEPKDLKTIVDIKEIWNNVEITSPSPLINTLLYINKCTNQKTFVELLSLNKVHLKEDETFLREFIDHVTERRFLFIEETRTERSDGRITFHLNCEKKNLCNIEIGNRETQESYQMPKFEEFYFDLEKFNNIFIDYEEIIQACRPSTEDGNLHSNLIIFNNYLNTIKSKNKKIKTIIRYPNIIQAVKVVNFEIMEVITTILNIADINIFEKKDALSLLNMIHLMNNDPKNSEEYDDKQLEYLFSRYITLDGARRIKLGLFLDDFHSFTIIEANVDHSSRKDYEISIYPKINHTNQKVIDEYKKNITVNYQLLSAIFYGGFFSKFMKKQQPYPAFLVGNEISKRILEILRNSLSIPEEHEFYIVKLPKHKINQDLEKENLKKKEEKFVLDCVNKNNSSLKFYNPLFDDHLNSFFSSETIRKQLKNKGFINTNGFVLYDSVYRSVLEKSPPKFKRLEDQYEREKKLLNVIKQNNIGVKYIIIFRLRKI
jgi:hypothetical protein